ncbi:SDR family NAD(P)-dependent oxidoreductase [Candidatus Micrarchaeota archaeon]|nr:SDR family NAD(P)-dependent oxidoreductase [Candidatus Micrarchaeota archaeon]
MSQKTQNFRGMESKKVLITGGLGFIGSNIAQKLVPLGADVAIYDACLDPYGWNFANIKEIKGKVKFVKGDTRDTEKLKAHAKDCDYIIDCASQISHTISIKNPFLDIDINCNGALSVLEAARNANNNKIKLVYAGTRGQIGRMVYNPIDENHPTNPMDMNGINKLAAEKYYFLYSRLYGFPVSSLRINNAYGIRCQMKHSDYGIVNWFLRQAMENKQITINGKGEQTRDYSYVEDIADAFVLALQSEKANGEIFMLGSGKQTKFIDVCNQILKTAKSKMKINHQEWDAERKAIEIGNFEVSNEKIKSLLGWSPKTSLEDGLKKTYEFYSKRKTEYF